MESLKSDEVKLAGWRLMEVLQLKSKKSGHWQNSFLLVVDQFLF